MKSAGLVLLVLFLPLGLACDSEKGNGEVKPISGEACTEKDAVACGLSGDGTEAVLMCVPGGSDGLIWSEMDTCSRAEVCKDGACVLDCNSPYICDGRECGDDGCGGSCGACPPGQSCIGGKCVDYVCEPNCQGVECGPDGCGGSCGECPEGQVCIPFEFKCAPKPQPCKPDCKEKTCGPNGCGGQCGVCDPGTFCSPETLTCVPPCIPDCTGKQCGDDGCGGSCGGCLGENEYCRSDGTCGPCDPVKNLYCPPGSYCTYVGNQGPLCEVAGTQHYNEPCGGTDTCAEGICIELSGTDVGPLCYQICESHADCGEGRQCIDLEGVSYKVCTTGAAPYVTCNLLKQDCKFEDEGCYYNQSAGQPVCMVAGTGQEGEPCTGKPADCAKGLVCVSVGTTGWYCRKLCATKKGQEPSCDPESATPKCTNYYAAQSAGYCTTE